MKKYNSLIEVIKDLIVDRHNFLEWPLEKRAAFSLILTIFFYSFPLFFSFFSSVKSEAAQNFITIGLLSLMGYFLVAFFLLVLDIKNKIISNYDPFIYSFLFILALMVLSLSLMVGAINSNANMVFVVVLLIVYLLLGIKFASFWFYLSISLYFPVALLEYFTEDYFAWYARLFYPNNINVIEIYSKMEPAVLLFGLFTFSWYIPAYIVIKVIDKQLKQKEKKIKSVYFRLQKYLSPQIIKRIESNKIISTGKYERKFLTIFFSDIQGFTSMTDTMEAERMAGMLNKYLKEMSIIALKYGGTIDKFIGDAIMIFFGDPESKGSKEDARQCVLMAMEMRKRLKELGFEWEQEGIKEKLQIRIGISSGYCSVGNFGSEERMDYTILGSMVNLASRLEQKANADEILISSETYSLIKDKIECRKMLGNLRVKGFQKSIEAYRVKSVLQEDILEEIDEGFLLKIDPGRIQNEGREIAIAKLYRAIQALEEKNRKKNEKDL